MSRKYSCVYVQIAGTRPPCSLPTYSCSGPVACFERHQLLLQCVERLDVLARRGALEDAPLHRLQLVLQPLQHREIAVHHGVDQRVEHERRAVLEQVRLALGAGAHVGRNPPGCGCAPTARSSCRRRCSPRRRCSSSPSYSTRVHDREQRVAVLLELGALVAVARVLHRQLVQAELALHLVELRRRRGPSAPPTRRCRARPGTCVCPPWGCRASFLPSRYATQLTSMGVSPLRQ